MRERRWFGDVLGMDRGDSLNPGNNAYNAAKSMRDMKADHMTIGTANRTSRRPRLPKKAIDYQTSHRPTQR